MVSVKTVTIHITSPNIARVQSAIYALVSTLLSDPDVIFEIGVTKAEETK